MREHSIIYIEIERQIDFYYQMQQIEKHFELLLNMDGIMSARHQFELGHVHDISHKPFSFGGGILYLHTNQGVFSYKIQDNPSLFIDAFKTLKEKN
ncbi:hypothetical protein [Psychrobacillus vulpis]|uniref:hypothetical protein n=1 Tax=Psychrobacillus vulpis TaxID=2325572 RepID=UPI001F114B91|nr:hypothetical protein [Psychrobacillus vulpis]